MRADEIADSVVEQIIESGETYSISMLFNDLRTNDRIASIEFPDYVKDYFVSNSALPEWANKEKIAIGQQVYANFGPEIALCLMCKSLPEAYSCSKGAKVLYSTGRLTEQNGSLEVFTRRLMETAQFVVDVCSPDGLEPNGRGIETALKVRLIHAAIRYYLKKYGWDYGNGMPINQQDMAGTLQSFSALTLQGLIQLDVHLSEEEIDGYFHCWHVVGHLMGLEPEMNPADFRTAEVFGQAILDDQFAPSQEGVELTKALKAFMLQHMPGNIFKHTPDAIIRFLTGDKIANSLGLDSAEELKKNIVPRLLEHAFHDLSEVEEQHHFIKKIAAHFTLHFMQAMLNHFNDHKQIHFYIPPTLRTNWNI